MSVYVLNCDMLIKKVEKPVKMQKISEKTQENRRRNGEKQT